MEKKVLSILSRGHSGSTLLDIILGSIPGVFSMGEFHFLSWQLWRNGEQSKNGQDLCTCGKTFFRCDVWGKVLQQISEKHGVDYISNPKKLRLVLYGRDSYFNETRFLDRLLRELTCRSCTWPLWEHLLRLLLNAPLGRKVRNNWDVFDVVFDVVQPTCIVDSTKDIARFQALHMERPDQIVPLVLYRNARGIASSALKYKNDPRKELDSWLKSYNQRIFPVLQKLDCSYETVEYESLTQDPAGVRARIASRLGIEASPCPEVFQSKDYHLVAGNPMRYQPEIRVRYDDSWQTRLTPELLDLADTYQSKLKI